MTTKTYTSTIRHSSIAAARQINTTGTLAQAKRAATAEFGDEQVDYRIVIATDDGHGEIVSSRRVGDRKWIDAE